MSLERQSCCKVNLLLNILGRRDDGFHELETVMQPVPLFDRLSLRRGGSDIELSCSDPSLGTGSDNLVHRAASLFREKFGIKDGVRIHLEKSIPMAAGLGGGSGNAAATLLALNEMFQQPADRTTLTEMAASLGSDVPFFLENRPALAVGRGEQVTYLEPFKVLEGASFLLVRPGFGISTAWAYKQLQAFPEALNGVPGRAAKLVEQLQSGDLKQAGAACYNSLEAPALHKYPFLAILKEFLIEQGAPIALMSGSGSTVFAILASREKAEQLKAKVRQEFGDDCWITVAGT